MMQDSLLFCQEVKQLLLCSIAVHNLILDWLGGEGTLEADVVKFGYDVGAVVRIVEDGGIERESIHTE